jgi:pSer/pThr/pTyr-binding forkhead associated (FHA) protein
MKTPPHILVQLVHIQGPMKGEIQEFAEPTIFIGRNPSGHVHFPKDMTIISRKHAEITREGNRHKLVDHSANGTFVNGKRIQTAYLKDGDVLTFSEGGPKVSFLTKISESQPQVQSAPQPGAGPQTNDRPPREPAERTPAPSKQPAEKPVVSQAPQMERSQPQAPRPPKTPEPSVDQVPSQPVQVPLVIQYGPTLRSFNQVPITLGKNPGCEFVLDHAGVMDQHVQIYFTEDRYWIKDLTGKHMLSINGMPIHGHSPLAPNDTLALGPNGPNFRFLGGGRLAEIEEPEPEQPASGDPRKEPAQKEPAAKGLRGAKAIFDKFLRR